MNNCLLVIKNKKILNITENVSSFLFLCAKNSYYFDKIATVSFNNSGEITGQLFACSSGYDNSVVICPQEMLASVKGYLAKVFGKQFNEKNCLHDGNKSVYVMTDRESEFTYIIDSLNAKYGQKYAKVYFKCVGAPSDLISSVINSIKDKYTGVNFFVRDVYDEQTIEFTYCDTTSKMVVDDVIRLIMSSLGEYVYAMEDVSLAQRVFELLKLRRMKISVAESFTGGGISSLLVDVPGISEVYFEGLNTYSNLSKKQRLGVSDVTLKQYGAVSHETACQMAQSLIESGNCDVAISTTGIAGPSSDGTSKPVGLCFIGIGIKEGISVYKFNFKGDRNTVTKTAINHALFLAYKTLK